MKTIAHKPVALHSQVVTFSHELTPTKPKVLPSTIAPFDYERSMREFFAQKVMWVSFPSKAYMMQGRPSLREVALWLSLEGDERRYRYPYPDDDYFPQAYPASAFDQELSQEELLQKLILALGARLDDGRIISIIDLLSPHIPLHTLVDTLLAHVDKSLCGTLLMYVKQLDPALAVQAAEQLAQAIDTLNTWERPLVELQLCIIREDIKGLVSWFNQGYQLAFNLRTLAMEALGLIKDWETFRRIAYEQLENYSPVALRAHLENFGELGLQEAMHKIKETWSSTWGGVFQIHHPAVTELALWVLHVSQGYDVLWLEAQRWLHREGANAIVGALKLWEDDAQLKDDSSRGHDEQVLNLEQALTLRTNKLLSAGAQALLKDYIARGHDELVLSLAQEHAPQHLEALRAWAQASPAPDATLPAGCEALEYWFKRGMRHPIPDGVMPSFPILTAHGQTLSPPQTEGLLRLLQDQDRARAKEALKALERALDADSRHKLAEHLVMMWLRADNIPRLDWCLKSCGPLCAEGMERIYVKLKDQLIKQWQPTPWHWRLKSRLADIWRRLIEVIIANDSPTRMALLINELSAPPFYPEHGQPWVAPTEVLTSEGEHDARSRLDAFEDAILACQLSQPDLAQLYFNGLDQLHATWEVPQWRRLATEMARADLRTRTLWMLGRGEQEDALIFRLDMDGSLLDAQDQEISLAPATGRISRVGLERLSPLERAAWEQTLSEHELILYAPPNYNDDDDYDDDEEE